MAPIWDFREHRNGFDTQFTCETGGDDGSGGRAAAVTQPRGGIGGSGGGGGGGGGGRAGRPAADGEGDWASDVDLALGAGGDVQRRGETRRDGSQER